MLELDRSELISDDADL